MVDLVGALAEGVARHAVDLSALGLAWARATPVVALIPAFGLRALPRPAQALTALALGASIFPALRPLAAASGTPWAVLAVTEIVRGLPIALSAAVPLWAATMAGGLGDALRGAQEAPPFPTVEGAATPLGVLLSLLACVVFLHTGGPAHVAMALSRVPGGMPPLQAVVDDLLAGITFAVALAGPLLAGSVVVELAAALVARAASPAQIHAILAPLRALAMLGLVAVVLDRMASAMATASFSLR